jgi:hypothetical protein
MLLDIYHIEGRATGKYPLSLLRVGAQIFRFVLGNVNTLQWQMSSQLFQPTREKLAGLLMYLACLDCPFSYFKNNGIEIWIPIPFVQVSILPF